MIIVLVLIAAVILSPVLVVGVDWVIDRFVKGK